MRYLYCLLFIGLFACKRPTTPSEPLPENTPPSITRIQPSTIGYSDTVGATVTLEYLLADNEALKGWKLKEIRPKDTLLAMDTSLYPKKQVYKQYRYTIPNYDTLTRIRLRAWVYVHENLMDSTDYEIIVDFPRDTTQPFALLSYTNDTIYNRLSTTGKWAFNLLLRTNITGNDAARDIKEVTAQSGTFAKRFTSPNNNYQPVFVVFNDRQLNWNQLTYNVIHQSFSIATPQDTTPPLKVGDIVLIRLAYREPCCPNDPQYAAIYIRQIVDDGNASDEDYMVFDYKRSYKP